MWRMRFVKVFQKWWKVKKVKEVFKFWKVDAWGEWFDGNEKWETIGEEAWVNGYSKSKDDVNIFHFNNRSKVFINIIDMQTTIT